MHPYYKKIYNTPFERRDTECSTDNMERSFRVIVEAFEDEWDNVGTFDEKFMPWLAKSQYVYANNKFPETLNLFKYITDEHEEKRKKEAEKLKEEIRENEYKTTKSKGKGIGLPTYGEMFSDISASLSSIIKSGVKAVSNDEHRRRYAICDLCPHLNKNKRCAKCGCFVKIKSKFEAMHCPLGLW